MPYILALDQGTTSSRAIVFDHDGAIRAVAQKEFPQIFPAAGWVEHDPRRDLGVADRRRRRSARPRAGCGRRDIAAIGITNQRETTIVWDRETGEPVHNAIVWQDRRTADFCDRLKAHGAGAPIQAKTGLLIDAYFSASKIRWILDNVPGAQARADAGELAFGTVDSWLVWKLTGGARARHRRQQRLAHDALQHPHAAVGRRAADAVRRAARACCPRCARRARSYGDVVDRRSASRASRSPASPAISRRRSSARCAASRACRRTPTAPAASCCRTSARRRRGRRTSC